MKWHVFRAGLIVGVLFMLATSGAMLIKAQTAATEGMDELCGLNPGLHAAITDTLASHPPRGYEDTETYLSLMYFWGAVIKDAEWCTNGRRAGIDPDLAERTLRWHYGNASEFMRQYTAMVQGVVPTSTPTAVPPTPAPTAVPPTPTPTAVPEPIVLEGIGQTATDTFTLAEGIYSVAFTHNGSSNFIVYAHEGAARDLLVNSIGYYRGSRPLTGPGDFVLDIQADGAWSVHIEPLSTGGSVGFSGTGDDVSPLFEPPGTIPLQISHDGQRNFIVYVHCAGGSNLVQNEIGAVSGSRIVTFDRGPCFWEVRADGSWSLQPR